MDNDDARMRQNAAATAYVETTLSREAAAWAASGLRAAVLRLPGVPGPEQGSAA